MTKRELNSLGYEVIACAIRVHKALDPGLLESVYEKCLLHELKTTGLNAACQVSVPIEYNGLKLNANLRLDILVEDLIVVELKTVEYISPIHQAQILSYMRLLQKPKGMIINFYSEKIANSSIHLANDLFWNLPA
jgi:GxxExxY protein